MHLRGNQFRDLQQSLETKEEVGINPQRGLETHFHPTQLTRLFNLSN